MHCSVLFTCSVSVHSRVDCTALQVVCLPFRAKPCLLCQGAAAPTGSEEVPIAFKFLAQSGGCGAGAEKFLAKVLRVSWHRLFCKSSFPTESTKTWKSNSHSCCCCCWWWTSHWWCWLWWWCWGESDEDMSVGTGGEADRSNLRLSPFLSPPSLHHFSMCYRTSSTIAMDVLGQWIMSSGKISQRLLW